MKPSMSTFTGLATVLALAMSALVSNVTPADAQTTVLPAHGGPGGQPFTLSCPRGMIVRGVEARVGEFLDAVTPLCDRLGANGKFTGNLVRGARAGDTGGSPKRAVCAADGYVRAIYVPYERRRSPDVVRLGMSIYCAPLANPRSLTMRCAGYNQSHCEHWNQFTKLRHTCPSGQAVVGFHGRHGKFVDALGTICGPAPKLVATPAPTPTPAPKQPAPTPVGPPTTGGAVVLSDVDVYRREHGQGGVLGILPQNTFVFAVCNRQTKWCQVRGADLKTNGLDGGFVYVDFLRAQSSNSDAPLKIIRPKRQ